MSQEISEVILFNLPVIKPISIYFLDVMGQSSFLTDEMNKIMGVGMANHDISKNTKDEKLSYIYSHLIKRICFRLALYLIKEQETYFSLFNLVESEPFIPFGDEGFEKALDLSWDNALESLVFQADEFYELARKSSDNSIFDILEEIMALKVHCNNLAGSLRYFFPDGPGELIANKDYCLVYELPTGLLDFMTIYRWKLRDDSTGFEMFDPFRFTDIEFTRITGLEGKATRFYELN